MSQFNLWEWWESEGAEVLAFKIALPNPVIVENITEEELTEIVTKRLEWFDDWMLKKDTDESFKTQFTPYLEDYYHNFLKLNFKKTYDYQKIFGPQKDKKILKLTNEEKINKLWNDGKF